MVRVLVADDQLNIRFLVRSILESRGHSVTMADNGHQALEQLNRAAVDILVTDIQMPELDGLALTAIIRARFPAILIIVISAYPQEGLQALKAGATLFLLKPFSYSQLVGAVNTVLDTTPSDR